ncbi:AIM24 family protein [Dactylosporangium aurantiacum]|uniref:AIM24 family protein n=1 Tax=Dactylosporangium aurantiacum TaxID=35754 RepID=A0A9Q9IF71_9ACTN|nr:AIM24 family protein [Dactylosporangium aurantiacum]MDG6110037.1 AIM24 family protein [Dactylosporangium aurantiacum]UWZ54601.1 AIM24 family protein [Dactylosporangium aurantiacum]
MRSALFAAENMEKESQQPGLRLQNSKMLKAELNGEIMARTGTMVAYQGQVQFQALGSGGVGKWLKSKLTGEGVPLMKVSGRGDVFFADRSSDVHLIDLEPGDAISINGANVLAFDASLQYDIKMVQGVGMMSSAGLFNCVFTGQGRLAITTKGTPVVLTVDAPTYVDPQAAICWSASLQTGYHRADQLGIGTLLGRSTGEAFTMSFAGQGFVVVQPSEEPPQGLAGGQGQQQGGGVLGNLLGS